MDNNQNNNQLPTENTQQITPPIQGYFNQEPATSQATVPMTPTTPAAPIISDFVPNPVAVEQPQPFTAQPAVIETTTPVVTTETISVEQPVKPKKSHKLVIIISAAVFVVVLIGLIVGYLLINK